MSALVLTYHGIEEASGPLFVSPELFESHLDVIRDWGGTVLTVRDLAVALRAGQAPDRALAITFDDGFASVARAAAPLLAARGMKATVFCVAGHLGRSNDWPSQRGNAVTRELAGRGELVELHHLGFEIGSHGFDHAPLVGDDVDLVRREVVDARRALEDAVEAAVTTFAYPYGAGPSPEAAALVATTYDAACSTRPAVVGVAADPLSLPRVDAHYLRRSELLARALRGELGPYLRGRFLGARARRTLRRDYVPRGGGVR